MASNCSSNEPTEGLCPGDLKVVYEELFEIRAKWRRLGLKLDLTSGTLDAIQQRYLDPEDRLERTLLEWLNKGSATWRQIVKALFSCVVGETRLSQKLEEKYCQKGKNRKRKHESDSDEEVEQLDSEIKLMVKKFASLERDTRESMKKRKVSPKSLVAEIVSYRTFAAVLKKEDRLLADRQEDLEKATCIDEIFVIVSPFWSFLDFMILEHIINELGDDCDRQNLAVYITCLTDFLNSWKIEPIKVCRLEIGSQEKLHFKLKTSSLSMYRDVKAAIARILGVNSLALQLHSVKDGCVELVFLFPKLATHELLPLSPSVSSMLSEVNPQIQKISLVDDNTTETVIFKAIAPASLLDFEIHFEVFYQKLDVLKILPYLRAGAMLTGDIFYKLRSIPDDQEKRHYLCTHLLHRCRYLGFSQFAYCLVWSGQTALAKDIGIDVDAVPSCPYDDSWIHNELDFLLSFGCIKRSQLQTSLVFRWNRGKSVKKPMPIKMGLTVKSIIIDEVLYVGGGYADTDLEMCAVMKFEIKENEWSKLPLYDTMLFAMTSLFNKLVLVGGDDPSTCIPTNKLALLDSEKWTSLEPMNTARSCASAVSYKNRIIVAGGYTPKHDPDSYEPEPEHIEGGCISSCSVEVFDPSLKIWYSAKPLPTPSNSLGSALVGDTLYLMGGRTVTDSASKIVYKVDLNMLVRAAIFKTTNSTSTSPWKTIADTHYELSVPLGLGGSLLSFGGCDVSESDDEDDSKTDNPTSAIYLYQPDSNEWVKVGDLPTPRYGCACSVLPSGEIAVAGGYDGNLSSDVDFVLITSE